MLRQDGWFDWAERMPGPYYKLYDDVNSLEAVFFHSAVGTLDGVINAVLGPAEKSVTAVVGYDGRLVQFYRIDASAWAQGSAEWNCRGIGIEFEGGYDGDGHWESEPIYDLQVQAAARILQDLAAWKDVPLEYWQRPTTLKEHCEVYPTACPSGRIRWEDIMAEMYDDNPTRLFLTGDESGGIEKRGKQLVIWNEYVEVDAIGDVEGDFPGQHWHNQGGEWVPTAP